MVLIRCPRKEISVRIRRQWKIRSRAEVDDIERRGAHQRSRLEGVTDLTPPQLDTGVFEVSLMSGERLLEAREL